MNDQDIPKNNNPKIRNVFSLKLKSLIFIKKKQYITIKVDMNIGIIFEVINIKTNLYLSELNKYFIPAYAFSEKIEEICREQQGVLVEKTLSIRINTNGKKVSKYLLSLL